ncbi:hypothetical protein F8388_000673 [Cannabis sativa]|uniref:valine--tRNA ligase n=1 Tax=Cannabis sativa TaxID=3483 RepID=A0A7J6EAN0_CANSA|nr:hypothetical protein G4B88_020418 [Cannabis sativa]KAF4392546.1 hypothetical protein F8388_000673 [Cannabis sativa]
MIIQTAFSAPSLWSSCSAYRFNLNPLLFSKTRRRSPWHFTRLSSRLFAVAASANGTFTSPEIAKSFDFTSEERIYNWWDSQGYFKPNFDRGGDPFVISMPPPNVTGSLHMGHAMFVTLEDIMVRYNRMKGRPTLWIPGTDHAGIATQLVVERMLASEGIKRVEMSRDDFTKRVWEWKEKYGGTITNQIKRLGASCDWSREHFTLDVQLSGAVIEAFVRLHDKGLIYQGTYMVNWSPSLQTAVSDLYRVAGGSSSDYLTIATTRPETLFGDVAVAVHPKDGRYSKYIGKMAIVPMTYGRHVPIIADMLVDKDFGTGVLKISPGHDHNDYNIAKKLGLPILNVMNKDGTLNNVAGLGLDRFEARKKLWSDLEETGLAVKKEPHTLRVPRSQRGGEVIEPLVSRQWFVTMEPLADNALQAVEKGDIKIIPERFEKDWCISRQLWWGHRIPVWYIEGKDNEEEYIVARNADEALKKAQEKYGKAVKIYQDPDVLDTWFSSALWPFSTLGWPDVSSEDFKQLYPTTVLETGHDILFFWVARMIMMGIEFTGRVPFSYVYLHGLIRDSQGRKMSKTLGNVIDPLDTIKEFGTDALRFTLALGTAGQDLNLSTERLTSNKAFTNKLWNAGKFILQNLPSQDETSVWENIHSFQISKLHLLVDAVTVSYDKYIEASKARLYNNSGDSAACVTQAVLLYVFQNILKILHPFMPFVTEELWQALPNRKEALMVSSWPQVSLPRDSNSIKKFENLQALTRSIRNARAEYSVEPAKPRKGGSSSSIPARFTERNAEQSVHLVAGEGLEAYLPLADMVDVTAEVDRLTKRLSKMQAEYEGYATRLSSPKFVEKAPEDIVSSVREKAAEVEEKINLTKNRLSFLKSTVLVSE